MNSTRGDKVNIKGVGRGRVEYNDGARMVVALEKGNRSIKWESKSSKDIITLVEKVDKVPSDAHDALFRDLESEIAGEINIDDLDDYLKSCEEKR